MKKLVLLIVMIPCLTQAQDITGKWRGINMNHLFKTCKTGAMNEYAAIGQTIGPLVLEEISCWVLKQTT